MYQVTTVVANQLSSSAPSTPRLLAWMVGRGGVSVGKTRLPVARIKQTQTLAQLGPSMNCGCHSGDLHSCSPPPRFGQVAMVRRALGCLPRSDYRLVGVVVAARRPMGYHQVNHTVGNLLLRPASRGLSLRPDLVIRPVTPQSTVAGALAERAAGIPTSHDSMLDAHTLLLPFLSFHGVAVGTDATLPATLRGSCHPLASIRHSSEGGV
jgi:hypothetical protein